MRLQHPPIQGSDPSNVRKAPDSRKGRTKARRTQGGGGSHEEHAPNDGGGETGGRERGAQVPLSSLPEVAPVTQGWQSQQPRPRAGERGAGSGGQAGSCWREGFRAEKGQRAGILAGGEGFGGRGGMDSFSTETPTADTLWTAGRCSREAPGSREPGLRRPANRRPGRTGPWKRVLPRKRTRRGRGRDPKGCRWIRGTALVPAPTSALGNTGHAG